MIEASDSTRSDDKDRIATSFARAAKSYSSKAVLQHKIAQKLLQLVPAHKAQYILDAGCGSGSQYAALYSRFPNAHLTGLDLSHGMLRQAQQETGQQGLWLQADVDKLPIAQDSIDLVYSNLAIQWCADLGRTLRQFSAITRSNGLIACSTLADGSLNELHRAWAGTDTYQHANRYATASEQLEAIEASGLEVLYAEAVAEQIHFDSFNELLRNLKLTGVSMVREERRPGLTTPSQLKQIAQRFEHFREDEGLPLRYHVLYMLLRKP